MIKNILLVVFFYVATVFADMSTSVMRLPTNTIEILKVVSNFLPDNPIIVEAGACDGSDTLILAHCWRHGRIYSFEPVPEHFHMLVRRTKRLKNVRPVPLALSDQNGVATLYLSRFNGNLSQVSASSSLLPPKEHLQFHPEILFQDSIDVATITLDDWGLKQKIDHVDFFWLDMQGYELNMLKVSQLAKTAKAIWMEVEFKEAYAGQYLFKDINEWMELNGFKLFGSDLDVVNPENYFGNALFIKQK